MNKLKSMLLAVALGTGAIVMAQSASWTFYNPDNIKHQGTQTDHTIVAKVRTAPTLADFNNDGNLEMVYGGQNIGDWDWYWQEKDGEWQWAWNWHYDWNNAAYVIGFNGWNNDPTRLDGKTDYWTFETDTYGIPLGTYNFYRWIDFNNDGNLDLIMFAKSDYDERKLNNNDGYWNWGGNDDGTDQWVGQTFYSLIYQNGGAAANYKFSLVDKAPFNVVDGNPGFNHNDGWYNNDADIQLNRNNRGLTFGDINNDGYVDFVSQNKMGLKIWLGKGDGSFECIQTIAESYREGDVKLADLDGDGNLDFVVTGL